MDKLLERFRALSLGGKIILIAGLVLFIDGFLPWYRVSFEIFGESVSASRNAWESPGAIWSVLAILIGLAMAALVALKDLTDVQIPDNVGGVSWPRIFLGAGAATVLLVVIKLLNESSHLGIGFYIGILAAIALAVAGFLMYREEMAA
jgi:hypothetical protein